MNIPLLITYLCYWSCKYFINICLLWYFFLTQHGNSLAVTLQRRQMGCPCQVCSVLEKGEGAKLDEPLQWPAGPSQLPFFSVGVVWKQICLGIKTDTLIMSQGGCREAGDQPVGVGVSQPIEMNTCSIINPWKSVMWHAEIEVSALHVHLQVTWSLLSKGKASLTSAGGHIAAPSNLLPKLDAFFKYHRYHEFFKSLGTAVANYLIYFMAYFLFEHEGTN